MRSAMAGSPPGSDPNDTPLETMPGNTIGKLFTVTSFGESHGPAIGATVDGCPPGLALSEADIQTELERRRSGKSRHTSQRREADAVASSPGCSKGARPALRSSSSSRIPTSVRATTRRSGMSFGLHTPTTCTARSTETGTTGGRTGLGPRDRNARGGRRNRQEVHARTGGHRSARLPRPARAAEGAEFRMGRGGAQSFLLSRCRPRGELERFMDALRKEGDSAGARITVVASGARPDWANRCSTGWTRISPTRS